MLRKIRKVVVTWAGPEWRPKLEASLSRPELQDLTVVFSQDRAELLEQIKDADAVYVSTFDPELLRAAPRLKWIHFMRGGVDNAMFPELVESPIVVTCLKELFSAPGAEFALMSMLMVQRRMDWCVGRPKLAQSAGSLDQALKPEDLAGRTVAILGLGNIGRRIAELCRAFHLQVLGTARSRPLDPGLVDRFYPSGQIREMLAAADFVVVALPLTPETAGSFNAGLIAAVKRGAWIIDVSGRPALFDYGEVQRALRSGSLGGVVLQPCGTNHPAFPSTEDGFWQLPNVMVASCRCVSVEQQEHSLALFPENLLRLERGQSLRGVVDKAAGY